MTAVVDFTVPGPRPRTVAPTATRLHALRDDSANSGFPRADSTHCDDPRDVLADLSDLVADLGGESGGRSWSEAEWIDRIAELESLQHRLAAAQSAAIHAFARQHAATQTASGVVEPEKLERSIGAQIALACRVSPTEGKKRLHTARDLRAGHDHVRSLFTTGQISAYKTSTITTATAHLDPAERGEVDRRLTAHDLAHLGVGRIRDLVGRLAAEVAPDKFTQRCRAACTGRRVSLRPAADGMTNLTAHLPLEQGVACYAALVAAVNEAAVGPGPVTRGRGQIMADTLVERTTGQATADAVTVEVQIVVPVEALIDPDRPLPAHIPGHGPVPTALLATSTGRTAWRRLITRDGIVIGGDSRQRLFTGHLAALIRARDGHRCSEPYCDAPIRHIDQCATRRCCFRMEVKDLRCSAVVAVG